MMIPFVSSCDEDLFTSAYANINLIADKTWAFDKQNLFHKLNQSLWIQHRKVNEEIKRENATRQPKRVRDVIPDSRLARYGNYEYNEEREKMYRPEEATGLPLPRFCWTEVTEPWTLPEVEEHFSRLTSARPQPSYEPLVLLYVELRHVLSFARFKENLLYVQSSPTMDTETATVLRNQSFESSQKVGVTEKRSTNASYDTTPDSTTGKPEKSESEVYERLRYEIENAGEMQLHVRVNSVRGLWNAARTQQQYNQQPTRSQCCQQHGNRRVQSHPERPGQQVYCAVQYPPLLLRAEYQYQTPMENYGLRKPLPPNLCPEVPEFFPKPGRFQTGKEFGGNRVQYFPAINERTYQNELFPYRTHESPVTVYQNTAGSILPVPDTTTFLQHPQHWFQRIPAPTQMQITSPATVAVCTSSMQPLRPTVITHRPLQMQEKFISPVQPASAPIPVYQRPLELYHDNVSKRKSQGVDFKNLILLTKNATKTHRAQSRTRQEKHALETKARNTKTEQGVLQWFEKGRSNEPATSKIAEQRKFVDETKSNKRANSWEDFSVKASDQLTFDSNIIIKNSNTVTEQEKEETNGRSKRRLYRDVLTNHATCNSTLENAFEKRYDELEQQAMEQYRTSEESLALKYQELERQAMEQYACSNTQETNASSHDTTTENRMNKSSQTIAQDCTDGQRCPGFGHCSPESHDTLSNKEPRIILIKPESKSGMNVPSRTLCNELRSTVSKSLTALTQRVSCETVKYSSRNARASTKRRLILVSPFEHKSETRLLKKTNLPGSCQTSKTKRNVFSYGEVSIRKNGSGDENATVIRSPKAEVWLSGFWTT